MKFIQNIAGASLLIAAFIATTGTLQAGVVAHWSFNESAGNVAYDNVGPNNGILSPSGSSFVSGGVSGNALSVSFAANGFVNVGNVFPFTSGDFSLVAWVKMTQGIPNDASMFISKHAAFTRNGYYLCSWSTDGKALMTSGDYIFPNASYSTNNINDGQWHLVVGVYKAGVQKLIYVDGAPAEGTSPTQSINPNSANVMIGGCFVNGVPSGKFTGLIDEVQIYDHALSPDEVNFLFHNPGEVVLDCPQIVNMLQLELNNAAALNLQLQNQLNNINGSLDWLTALFQTKFKDPNFQIVGGTPDARVSNLISAIERLNPGQQQALYLNLKKQK